MYTLPSPLTTRSLGAQIAWVFGGFAAVLAVCLGLLAGEVIRWRLQEQAGAALSTVAHNAATMLASDLVQQSRRAQILARSKELWMGGLGSETTNDMLDRMQHVNPHSVWIGVTDAKGKVLNATKDMLLGQDVSSRAWFQEGLVGPFISEVHPAKLLAGLLPPSRNGEPLRLVDFSAPIYSPDGSVAGVLGVHGSWEWVREGVESLLEGPGRRQQQSVFIFDKDGALIYAPNGVMAPYTDLGQRMPKALLPRDPKLDPEPAVAVWKDRGRPYLAAAARLPLISEGATDLGWWIVARQPVESAYADANRMLLMAAASGLIAGLLAALVAWLLASHLSRDLQQLAQAASRIRQGDVNATIPIKQTNREVQDLSQSLAHMTQQLLRANDDMKEQVRVRTQELQHANTELERQARTDPLTGLLNRRGFETQATLVQALARRSGRPLSVLTLDIDFFKRINDTYGHDVGDAVLVTLAHTLQQRAREADVLARFGGEEFVLLLPDTDLLGAEQLGNQLRECVQATAMPHGQTVTVSMGASSLLHTQPDDDLGHMLKRSDEALYQAKHQGRNCVCVHTGAAPAAPAASV